jgi:flagellar export protein FliJ
MARFAFPLELPLRLARVRRGQARRELASAIHAAAAAEQALQQAVLALRETGRQIDRERVAGVDGGELAALTRLHERTRARVPQQRERCDAAAEQAHEARGALAAATREAQVLERLREESRARFLAEEGRRAQVECDDLAQARRARGTPAARQRRGKP